MKRSSLSDTGMGMTGLALGALLQKGAWKKQIDRGATGKPPRAKSVIWIFLCGGTNFATRRASPVTM